MIWLDGEPLNVEAIDFRIRALRLSPSERWRQHNWDSYPDEVLRLALLPGWSHRGIWPTDIESIHRILIDRCEHEMCEVKDAPPNVLRCQKRCGYMAMDYVGSV
jgi:hypothetical protein